MEVLPSAETDGRMGAGKRATGGRKDFFFEKKKQKTFGN
jgi:hypothetical protein